MDATFPILTPEKAVVTYRLAGLGSRVGAFLLDALLVTAIISGIQLIIGVVGIFTVGPLATLGFILFLSFVVPFLYLILQEGLWNGQTVGKKAAGIRVRMADGTPITFGAALARNLLLPADLLPGMGLVGIMATFLNPRAQRLGDLVANTVVTYERRSEVLYIRAPHKAGIHPLESYVGPLTGMNDEDYAVLRRYADRFPQLTVPAQNRLTREVFLPIADSLKVPHLPNVHPIYMAEAMVMKYGRDHGII